MRSLRCARIGEWSLEGALTPQQTTNAFGVAPAPMELVGKLFVACFGVNLGLDGLDLNSDFPNELRPHRPSSLPASCLQS